jgi:hypothetical protein
MTLGCDLFDLDDHDEATDAFTHHINPERPGVDVP